MNRSQFLELLLNGENSGVEFKRDDIRPQRLAGEIVALLNLEGGHILLGVEDDASVSGLTRESKDAEEWVMQIAREHIQPSMIPYWETLESEGVIVGVLSLPADAPDKPYKAKTGASWITKIRVGTTTRDASREEEERLYQQSGRLRYGLKPVLGTTPRDFDVRRLRDYFVRVRGETDFAFDEVDQLQPLLFNLELATESAGYSSATVDGLLLFGENLNRFLPQSGIRAICYQGTEPDYAVRADEDIRGPLTPLGSSGVDFLAEPGIVDRAWDFVRRNTASTARFEGAQRHEHWEYPEEVIREVIVNALIHRDYSIAGTDVTLSIFSDRLEIQSPGRLPNTVSVEGMRSGMRYARNQTLVNVMRDYGYVDARGMGIRNKVIPLMYANNGTEPDLIEEENRFTVRLWKGNRK